MLHVRPQRRAPLLRATMGWTCGPTVFTRDRVATIMALAGKQPVAEIASRVGVSEKSLRQWASVRRISLALPSWRKPTRFTPDVVQRIREMAGKVAPQQIAEAIG